MYKVQKHTQETTLDRWVVTLTPLKPKKPSFINQKISPSLLSSHERTIYIQNYLSIGVDALVTYNFHKTRENKKIPFSGRMFNKMIYFVYGTKDVLERECQNLNTILDVYLDGIKIELPNIER